MHLKNPAMAGELKKQQKHVILLWLAGGASQLETWDPKPGRPTGGPYRPIKTDVPGIEISELLPKMAQRMKHTAIIRSLNTRIADHGGGASLMEFGRRQEPAFNYPDLGAICARELAPGRQPRAGLRFDVLLHRRPAQRHVRLFGIAVRPDVPLGQDGAGKHQPARKA